MELMSAEFFNGEIDRYFGQALCDIGFSKIKENLWVQDSGDEVRRVVTIMHWKGAQSTPRWGYSLDYVPHFDNSHRNIYWHRTNKSAMIDVFPLYFDFVQYAFSRFSTPEKHIQGLRESTPKMISDLQHFYTSGDSPEDLVSILERSQSTKTSGLGFWNWIQMPLSYAFILNKIGQEDKANQVLAKYTERAEISPAVYKKLMDRFNEVGLNTDGAYTPERR